LFLNLLFLLLNESAVFMFRGTWNKVLSIMKDLFKFLLELKVATMFAAWGLNDGSILRF